MTLAQFHAAVDGYMRAHAPQADKSDITAEDFTAVLAEEMAAGRA